MDSKTIIILVVCLAIVISGLIIYTYSSRERIYKLYYSYLNKGYKADLTGIEYANLLINEFNLKNIKIAINDEDLSDCYIPKRKTLVMSSKLYNSPSISSVAIIGHEIGHAIQDKNKSKAYKFSKIINKLTLVLNKFIMPILIVGLILLIFPEKLNIATSLLFTSLGIFVLNLIFRLSVIIIEHSASNIVLQYIQNNDIVTNKEYKQVKKLLKIALLTYISSFLDSIFFLKINKK